MNITKIVLTGGPCGGKSTSLKAIREKFGEQVLVVPEVATILLSGGFPIPGQHVPFSPEWQHAFQAAVAQVQQSLEQAYELTAKAKGIRVLVCDRGLLDGAAYMPGGMGEFCQKFQIDQAEAHQRYAAVIHLESVATAQPELYGKAGNESRYESLTEAQALELRSRKAWSDHPNWIFIQGGNGINSVTSQVMAAIYSQLHGEVPAPCDS